jgi:FolB domain-containing protein
MFADRILIKDLLLRGIIGINDWEREKKQDILINITLYADLSDAGKSDTIQDTVNYRSVTKQVIAYVDENRPYTVEHLAEQIARICVSEPGVQQASVRIEKPGAVRFASSVGVEIDRKAEDFA